MRRQDGGQKPASWEGKNLTDKSIDRNTRKSGLEEDVDTCIIKKAKAMEAKTKHQTDSSLTRRILRCVI
jgi:hypothetical protein